MKKVATENLNTTPYWNEFYRHEAATGVRRVFTHRLDEVLRWVGLRQTELPDSQMRILDVGCGLGDVGLAVLSRYAGSDMHYTGVDFAPAPIEHMQMLLDSTHRHLEMCMKFDCMHAAALEYEADSFDLVWCGETLEHLDDPLKALTEIFRVTKPGGYMVLSTPYRDGIPDPSHVWEFEPADMMAWATPPNELLHFTTRVLPNWSCMLAVIRCGAHDK